MEKLTELLFEAHRNPIVKLNTSGNKIYLSKNTEEEKALVSNNIEILKNTIKFPRVERRCGRSLAIWLEDKHLAKVIKKHYQSFGFQDKNGIYLYPEEALFLLETNRLEILWKDISISIQQAYSLIIKDDICSLDKYKIYKKLVLQGNKISKPVKKMQQQRKKMKLMNKDITNASSSNVLERDVSETKTNQLTERLLIEALNKYDYKICSPKKKDYNNVHIIENGELDPKIGLLNDGAQNLFAIVLPDNVAFYRFGKISIPDISNNVLK